jgi:very-short-patch-repair endonuclease
LPVLKRKLIIELDGGQHQDEAAYDLRRTAFLNANGWEVLRFWNNEFMVNEEEVLMVILQKLQSLMPSPFPGEGEGTLTPSPCGAGSGDMVDRCSGTW